MMRTTLDIPPELHDVLSSLATSSRRTFSQTAVELMRRGLEVQSGPAGDAARSHRVSPVTGLPQVRLRRTVTEADVRALEDEG